MKKKILLLRICYWTGAILDALTVIPMLSPKIGGGMLGLSGFSPGNDYRYAMGTGASLMIGWTLLLLWADRKPLERRGILLLTIPVLAGLMLSGIFAVNSGMIAMTNMLPVFIMQIIVASFFTFGYVSSSLLSSGQ